ncbi:NADH dehydrogenase subunit E [Sulfurifustis variabilis]|uniref:NADH-quinone oxidoreductase subunit E n=1 Tax=Sulfurifustis variabilis TaxID=1675686 RepID=A0A1B4V5Y7_9GAMM|nr:NADH-quinone oxidoreductase subunit NuoE [Sulfurifustis variabilis]BAU48963.1 NADH dehydrogenase subunit E [Sulfurifustis variabilis]
MGANPSLGKADLLSAAAKAEIDRWTAKFPPERRRAAALAALTIVQNENRGWLTPDLIEAVAEYLDMPPVAAMEVATFYSLYDHAPVGRHKIYVCNSISCWLCGSERIIEHLEKKFGVKLGQTSPDGRFTLKASECLAACGGGPMFMIDGRYYENLTPEKVDEILGGFE